MGTVIFLRNTFQPTHQPTWDHSIVTMSPHTLTFPTQALSAFSIEKTPHPSNPHSNQSRSDNAPSCIESYRLFQRCSKMNADTEGFSCSVAVKTYMSCALDGC